MVRWGDLLNVGCLWLLGHGTRNARFYVLHVIRSGDSIRLNRFKSALKNFIPDLNRFKSGMNPFKSAQQTFNAALNPFKPRLKGFAEMINARNRAFRKFKF